MNEADYLATRLDHSLAKVLCEVLDSPSRDQLVAVQGVLLDWETRIYKKLSDQLLAEVRSGGAR